MANAALLALGSIGKALAESDPQQAEQIRDDLVATLDSAGDAAEAGVALKAMENMGDPALGEVISPYLQDDAPIVRSAAARSMGRLKGEDSPDTARELLIRLYAQWLEHAGAHVPRDRDGRVGGLVEISPLFALDSDELKQKLPASFEVKLPLYLGPE